MGFISFDIDHIQEYVFSSYRPIDIFGASELVKSVEASGEVLQKFLSEFKDTHLIFAHGGTGLIRVPDDKFNERMIEFLESDYSSKTDGSLSAVFHPAERLSPEVFQILQLKLREKKMQKNLYTLPGVSIPANPEILCDACGIRKATLEDTTTNEKLCKTCYKLRQTGRNKKAAQANSLEDLIQSPDHRITMIYADLKNMGNLLKKNATDENSLKNFSTEIYTKIQETISSITKDLNGKFLAPVIGGDDILLILPAYHTVPAVETILDTSDELIEEYGTLFNLAFATAYYKFPFYLLFQNVKSMLSLAKSKAYKLGKNEGGIMFQKIAEGKIFINENIEEDLSTCKPYTIKDFRELLYLAKEFKKATSTLLYNIYQILTDMEIEEEKIVNIQYLLVKNRENLPEKLKETVTSDENLKNLLFSIKSFHQTCNKFADILELTKIIQEA